MFFECRAAPSPLAPPSEPYRPAAELFAAGRTREARRALAAVSAARLRLASPAPRAADLVLTADVLRAAGESQAALTCLARGLRHFPDDRGLLLAWLFETAGHREPDADVALLERVRQETPERERGPLDAVAAVAWARAGMARRAAEARDRALVGGLRQSLVVGCLAEVELRLHRFDEAVEFAHRAIQQAPRWARGRRRLAQTLAARCRLEEATRVLWTLADVRHPDAVEDAPLELETGLLLFHLGDHQAALPLLWRYQFGWPGCRRDPALAALLPRLPWRLGELPAGAQAWPGAESEAGRATLAALAGRRATRQVSVPPLRVERDADWAAAISMSACGQGAMIEPRTFFDAGPPRDGMPLWRLIDLLTDRHFRVEPVRADPEVLCSLLEQQVAPLGQVAAWPFPRIEVVCGFDRDHELFLVHEVGLAGDGGALPKLVPFAGVAARYEALGGLLAVMTPLRAYAIALPPDARSGKLWALLEMERAAALGERERLERSAARLPASTALALRREVAGIGILAGPLGGAARVAELARDPGLSPAFRRAALWRLLTSELGRPAASPLATAPGDGLAQWLAPASIEPALAAFFGDGAAPDDRRAGRLLRAVAARDAAAVGELARRLGRRWPAVGLLWRLRAQAAAWRGEEATARACAERAVELASDDVQALALLRRLAHVPPPALEAIGELRRLVEVFPYDHWLKLDLVAALALQADGQLYERALLETLRYLPRWPPAWWMLFRWYESQDRDDLARAVRERAALWLDAEELAIEPSLDPAWWLQAAALGRQAGRAIRGNDPLAARLPSTLPGPCQASLIAFLEGLSPLGLDPVFAAAVSAWIERLVGGEPLWPLLDGLCGLLEEARGDLKAATARYLRLQREQPGFALPWQRMGELLEKQRDPAASLEAHRRVVASRQAEPESYRALARLEQGFGHPEGELRAREALCRLWPYAFEPLEELAMATLEHRGLAAALEAVEERRNQQPQGDLAALRARVRAEAGDHAGVDAELERRPEARRARPLLVTIAELLAAEARADYRRASALIEEGLELEPDHSLLMRALARDLERRSPARLLGFFRDALARGQNEPRFARDWLERLEDDRIPAALGLLDEAAKSGSPGPLANLLAGVFAEIADPEEHLEFLAGALERLPRDADLLALHTRALIAAGRKDEAVASARRLQQVEPEAPRAIGLLAACLRDIAPREAHLFLVKEYEKTGAFECLTQIADSHQRLGESAQAAETWRQVLAAEPENPLALAALFELGDRRPGVVDGAIALVARGRGFDHRRIHVLAVELALAAQRTLPEAWLEGAQRRFEQLRRAETEETADERLRLGLAIAKWLHAQGRKEEAKIYRQSAGSTWRRLKLLDWPSGRRWIPNVTIQLENE